MFDEEINPLAILNMSDEEKEEWLFNSFEESYYDIQAMLALWEKTGIPLVTTSDLPSLVKALSLACYIYRKRNDDNLVGKLH